MPLELFNVISPVLFIALGGYLWVKLGYDFPKEFVTRLNMNLGAPCLVFVGLLSLGQDLSSLSTFIFASFIAISLMLIVTTIFVFVTGLPKRGYIISLSSSNCGNMGIPLCLFAFGDIGMSFAIAYFTVGSFFQFTVALFISHGNLKPGSLIRVSLLWGIFAALFFILTERSPPTWLMNTTELLAGVTIPLMLLTLGASLATLKVVKFGKIFSIGLLKMALGMSIGIATASYFGFEGVERNVLIMQMSMPVAVFSYLLASRYNRNPDEVASLIFTTTLISFITVPLMLVYLF
ncbi:MAG: AEC family transporter [Kordiimonadaceae bacterium]|jgi:malate permease and related proteins|nr:AEC family transporter [Kordiimonadaceae bacterium]MBT6036828.1 AEC family transporter [Kordiimonadaceae bacterium]MBT6328339.1 AEC family transporter [Kordiimonadaceae bacterium]MBT7581465.1 AEC family transporter [Kordiimonadaceae bacterium]